MKYIKKNNLMDVKVLLQVEPEKRYIYLWQSDVIVLPSVSEDKKPSKFKLSIGEASMYCKQIIACSEIDGDRDTIVDGKNGFLVDEWRADALHAAVGIIVTNQLLLKRMKEARTNKPKLCIL